jgi:hypothetical protein
MNIWGPLAASVVMLIVLTVMLFWEGRRSFPPPPIHPRLWTALPTVALFAYLMRPLWLTMPGEATVLLVGLVVDGLY